MIWSVWSISGQNDSTSTAEKISTEALEQPELGITMHTRPKL